MPEHPSTAGVDERSARRQLSRRRDRRVDRVAGRRHQRQLGHLLKLPPVLVAAGALALLSRLRLVALERVHAPGQMRERGQIAAGLQLAPGQHRREAQLLGAPGGGLSTQALVQVAAHVLEHRAVPVHAGDPGLQQQAGADQLGQELGLILGGRACLWRHDGYTSLAISSSPASTAWIDPDREMFVILLTNRVHAARAKRPAKVIADVRADLADAAALAVTDANLAVAEMPVSFRADRAVGWNRAVRVARSARRKGTVKQTATPKSKSKKKTAAKPD